MRGPQYTPNLAELRDGTNVHVIDPLSDRRWDELVACHPLASVFHERGWLEALARTYCYEPFALTSAPPGEPLRNGVALCRVASWITGTRLVSLPFSDHCAPLVSDPSELEEFLVYLRLESDRQRFRYVELRPLSLVGAYPGLRESASYHFHLLDLHPSLGQIFGRFHKDSVQRRIRKAEKEGLSYEAGRSEQLMGDFYRLLLLTRRRHRLFPQPRAWFRNLLASMGEKVQMRVARKDGSPIAAMLTLHHGSSVVYKYGCSDESVHHLGGMPFLFWKLIEESKSSGAEQVDFGRSDLWQESLVAFKEKFGATRQLLKYYRYSQTGKKEKAKEKAFGWGMRAAQRILPMLPDAVLEAAGGGLYKHGG